MTEEEFMTELAELNLRYLTLVKARDDYSPATIECELTPQVHDLMGKYRFVQLAEGSAGQEGEEVNWNSRFWRIIRWMIEKVLGEAWQIYEPSGSKKEMRTEMEASKQRRANR